MFSSVKLKVLVEQVASSLSCPHTMLTLDLAAPDLPAPSAAFLHPFRGPNPARSRRPVAVVIESGRHDPSQAGGEGALHGR